MPLVEQPVHQRCVRFGPLVLEATPLKFPNVHSGYKPNCLTRVYFEEQPTVFLQRAFWNESRFAYGEPALLPFPKKSNSYIQYYYWHGLYLHP